MVQTILNELIELQQADACLVLKSGINNTLQRTLEDYLLTLDKSLNKILCIISREIEV